MSLSSFVARVGTNVQFIALWAHSGATTMALLSVHKVWPGAPMGVVVGALLVAAGVKEFWFDARYEVPTQTFPDNLEDWLGYAIGAAVSGWLLHA